jgi:hypothetical protein
MNLPMTNHYDEAFKRDAVQLLEEGRPLKKLAAELGLCPVTLRDESGIQSRSAVPGHGCQSQWLPSLAAPESGGRDSGNRPVGPGHHRRIYGQPSRLWQPPGGGGTAGGRLEMRRQSGGQTNARLKLASPPTPPLCASHHAERSPLSHRAQSHGDPAGSHARAGVMPVSRAGVSPHY